MSKFTSGSFCKYMHVCVYDVLLRHLRVAWVLID